MLHLYTKSLPKAHNALYHSFKIFPSFYIILMTSICLQSAGVSIDIINKTHAGENQTSQIKGKWVNSNELTPGMKVVTAENEVLVVKNAWVQRTQKAKTYNFEVANHHTYFVGEHSIWSHNVTTCDEEGRFANWIRRMRIRWAERGTAGSGGAEPLYHKDIFHWHQLHDGKVYGSIVKSGTAREITITRRMPADYWEKYLAGNLLTHQANAVLRGSISRADVIIYRATLRNPAEFEAVMSRELSRIQSMYPEKGIQIGIKNVMQNGQEAIHIGIAQGESGTLGGGYRVGH